MSELLAWTDDGETAIADRSSATASTERTFPRRELLHVRSFYPSFEWAIEAAPSPRNALRVPLAQARVGLVSPASGYERGQRRFSLGDENDASFRARPSPCSPRRAWSAGRRSGRSR